MLDDATKRSWAVTAVMAASVAWSGCISRKMQVGVTKWSDCELEIGRPSLRSRVSRGRTGVPSWGSGLKACGGGASPWQKDPRPQLHLEQSIVEAGYRLSSRIPALLLSSRCLLFLR